MFLTYLPIFILYTIDLINDINEPPILIYIIIALQALFYSNSIYEIPFTYAANIMTERGYTIMMMSYWLTFSIINFGLTGPSNLSDDELKIGYAAFLGFFAFMSLLVNYFKK